MTLYLKEFENLKEEKAQLSETLNKKELIIKDLEEETASDAFKQKMAALKKQNDSLKERITAFETTVNDLQDELKKSKHNLQVATANYNREVELNNILMKKTSQLSQTQPQPTGMSPQQNVEHRIDIAEDENVPEASPTANRSKENRSTNIARAKKNRGPCCLEYYTPGSCQYDTRCMFSHSITEADRHNNEIQKKMKQKMEVINEKTKRHSSRPSSTRKMCVHEFFEKGSCRFIKTRRGCNFSHTINEEKKKDPRTIQIMKQLKEKMAPNPQYTNNPAVEDLNAASQQEEQIHQLEPATSITNQIPSSSSMSATNYTWTPTQNNYPQQHILTHDQQESIANQDDESTFNNFMWDSHKSNPTPATRTTN